MKPFDDINTSLPYTESEEYVERLVEKCSREALRKPKGKTDRHYMRPWVYGAVSIAAAAIVMAVFIWKPDNSNPASSPIDSFLSGLTQEEIQMISFWNVDEIPEYYK